MARWSLLRTARLRRTPVEVMGPELEEIAVESPTRVCVAYCRTCGDPLFGRRRNGFCSDVCRLRGQKARRAELLERTLPDDPGRAE